VRLMPSRTAGTELTAASTSDARDCAVFVDGEELPSTSKPGGDGTAASNIYIEVDLSTQAAETAARRRDPFPGQLDAAPTAGYTTVRGVLSSRYMLSQVLFNMVGSATGPLLCFYLLFGVISTGPYSWDAPEVIGPILGSPFFASFLCPLLAPAGLPEATAWGFAKVPLTATARYARLFPFLGTHPAWRHSLLRHMLVGAQVSVLAWPTALLFARFVLGPTLSTWTQILGGVGYCVLLAPPITLLALLSLAVEPHYARAVDGLSFDPSPCRRLWLRVGWCLRLIW